MNSVELASVITALANIISCDLSDGQLSLVAALFVQLGDTLATIAAQRALCEQKENRSGE